MVCSICGNPASVHILGTNGYRHYCENCRVFLEVDSVCPECKSSYAQFQKKGFLGCAGCYDAFANRLETLMERYQNRSVSGTEVPSPSRMALARTEILIEQWTKRNFPEGLTQEDAIGNCEGSEGILKKVRFRMARNITGIPYLSAMKDEEKLGLGRLLFAPRSSLSEKFLSRKPADGVFRRAYTGDEDHLRVEWIFPYAVCDEILPAVLFEAAELDSLYDWQRHSLYGYLTACPGNSGLGLRCSVQADVNNLRMLGLWSAWKGQLQRAGYRIRGERGEGSQDQGKVQISLRNLPADADLKESWATFRSLLDILGKKEEAAAENLSQ